jgi:hypothetical protein
VIGGNSTVYTSSDPTGGTGAWTATPLPGNPGPIDSISCPTVTLCVATGVDGQISTSTDPTGGAGAWSTADIGGNRALGALFCSSASQCFGADNNQHELASSNPAGGATTWTVTTAPAFDSGSCPTPTLCVAVSNTGSVFTTTTPGTGTWTQTAVEPGLFHVACASASFCAAVGYQGQLAASTDPASGGWVTTTIERTYILDSIACPSAFLCLVGDDRGQVLTSTNAAGGAATWTPTFIGNDPCALTIGCNDEQILAADRTGVRVLDTSQLPGSGPFLTALTLTGDILSWSHNGTPESATLTPPRPR